jgi:hypothetical protein
MEDGERGFPREGDVGCGEVTELELSDRNDANGGGVARRNDAKLMGLMALEIVDLVGQPQRRSGGIRTDRSPIEEIRDV